jgi:pSer/pThr/pTyr-binding forkhead associated (FHA) protein
MERVSTQALNLAPMQTTFRVEEAAIILKINGTEPIMVQADKPIILGRGNNHNPRCPDVDLTAFKAFEKGVSCRHALLGYLDGKLMIADLGSANGTFVSGQRLVPHRSYLLQNGDEIRLANLGFRVEVAG